MGMAMADSKTARLQSSTRVWLLCVLGALCGCDRDVEGPPSRPIERPSVNSAEQGSGASVTEAVPHPLESLEWARIEPGSLVRQSTSYGTGEGLAQLVRLTRPYAMMVTEVTEAQWAALMGYNPTRPLGVPGYECPGRADCAVNRVSWYATLAFANQLSVWAGLPPCYDLTDCTGEPAVGDFACAGDIAFDRDCPGYRLPTEAEWEYAARAGSQTRFPCGDDPTCLQGRAIVQGEPGTDGLSSFPVASRPANEWGLYDMLGNVCEWVWDFSAPYGADPDDDPIGPADGESRVYRGGAFYIPAQGSSPAVRRWIDPAWEDEGLGFRLVRTIGD